MSDLSDYQADRLAQAQQGAWDPQLHANVQTPQGTAAYIASNPTHYEGYTGAVNQAPGTPVHAEAYGFNTGTQNDPAGQYRTDWEKAQLNPYSNSNQAGGQLYNDQMNIYNNMRVAPGVRPNFGYLSGFGGIDMRRGFRPVSWNDFGDQGYGVGAADPYERKMLQLAADRNLQFNKISDLAMQHGHPGQTPNFGRGYHYAGTASPEEQQMEAALMSGQNVDLNRLSQLRAARIQQNQLSGMQKIAQRYYFPALMAVGTAGIGSAGGLLGAGLGAGWGAFASGAQSGWKNPAAIGLGAAGGLAGGWGGGQLAGAMGAGPVVGGALANMGGAIGSNVGRTIGGIPWNTQNFIRDVGLAGVAGAAGGALMPGRLPGESLEDYNMRTGGQQILAKSGAGAVATGLGQFIPRSQPTPQMTPQQLADQNRRRQLALAQARKLNPYR